MNYRKSIIDLLMPYFEKDTGYHLLVMDSGFGAIDKMKSEMPERITNVGIMEQGSIGIAAGMAISGMVPVVYGVPNFICFRALEQLRNDVSIPRLNVKIIGSGCGTYFSFLGDCHTCGTDDIKLMEIIGIQVYDPYKSFDDFTDLLEQWITSPKAGYIRV